MMNKHHLPLKLAFKIVMYCVVLASFTQVTFTQISYAQDDNNQLSTSIIDLVNSGQLVINSRIKTEAPYILKQPIVVEFEVMTQRWFDKGVKVTPPSFNNIVFSPNASAAVSGTKKIKGESWTYLLKEITLYPMQAGIYDLPPFKVFVSVNTENSGIVEGEIASEALEIQANMPDDLIGKEYIIVSPAVSLTVNDTIDGQIVDTAQSLSIGDAITRSVIIQAEDVPSMMLPEVVAIQIEGLSIYRQPAQLSDKSNRGEILGSYQQTTSFIFEQAGIYDIPSQTITWFNLRDETISELIIPATSWQINGGSIAKAADSTTQPAALMSYFMIAIISMIMLLLIIMFVRYRRSITQWVNIVIGANERLIKKQLMAAFSVENYVLVCELLYRYFSLPEMARNIPYLHQDTDAGKSEYIHLVSTLRSQVKTHKLSAAVIDDILFNAYSGKSPKAISLRDFKQLLSLYGTKNHLETETGLSNRINLN